MTIYVAFSDEEGSALLDCIGYYRMADFGCGGSPADETQRQHVRDIRSAERKVLVATGGARRAAQVHVAEHGDSVEHRDRPEYGVGKVIGRKFDGRLIVQWPSCTGPVEAPSLRVVRRV